MREDHNSPIESDNYLIEALTHRELEVLSLFARGLSNVQIAEELTVALNTVKWYARQIYAKLGVSSREQAVARGRELGLIQGVGSKSNLPFPTTAFVGRLDELRAVKRLLRDPNCRLLNLVGLGGIGKTRLAIQVVGELQMERLPELADGVFFIPLAAVHTPEEVIPAIAKTLGFDFYRGELNLSEQLITYLTRKRLLLLLDNFEHLICDQVLAFLSDLLASAPGVTLLVTSQSPLNMVGEQVYPLGGLSFLKNLGDPIDTLLTYSGIQLFLQAARRDAPNFQPGEPDLLAIANICRLVEGLPLGIELAAVWIPLLTPAEILARMEETLDFLESDRHTVSERHRRLRVVFDVAWEMLSTTEQEAVAGLSVFRGGFKHQVANSVANISLKTLLDLVKRAWIHTTQEGRYDFHPLVQFYGAEAARSIDIRMDVIVERHTEYYCAFVKAYERELDGPEHKQAVAALDAEKDNVKAAWETALRLERIDLIAQAIDGLLGYYDSTYRFDEGQKNCQLAVKVLEDHVRISDTARCLIAKALIWQARFTQENQAQANLLGRAQIYLESVEGRSPDWQLAQSELWYWQGQNYSWHDKEKALELFELSKNLAKDADDLRAQKLPIAGLGWIYWATGLHEMARVHLEIGLKLVRGLGDLRKEAYFLNMLGLLERDLGYLEKAEVFQRKSVALLVESNLGSVVDENRFALSGTLAWRGKYAEGLDFARASLEFFEEIAYRGPFLAKPYMMMAYCLIGMGQYDEAKHCAEQCLEIASSYHDQQDIGVAYNIIGMYDLVRGDYPSALSYFDQSQSQLVKIHHHMSIMNLIYMSYIDRQMGEGEKAINQLYEGVKALLDRGIILYAPHALSIAALLAVDRGLPQRALCLFNLAYTSPAISQSRFQNDLFDAERIVIIKSLTDEQVNAARQQAQSTQVVDVLWEILEWLETQ